MQEFDKILKKRIIVAMAKISKGCIHVRGNCESLEIHHFDMNK